MSRCLPRLLLFSVVVSAAAAARVEFSWPTPNPAWEQRRPIEDYVQPTASGDPESGLSFSYLTNCRSEEPFHSRRLDRVSNLAHAALVEL